MKDSTNIEDIYNNLVTTFKKNKNKNEIISLMLDFCNKETTTNMDVYNLKKKMEINFAIDVNCTYCYILKTPNNYGCDLREIFYDRENNLIANGQSLLDIFKKKKLDDVWHIMTDVDDTLYPNTEKGTYIAGSDHSWAQKNPYPGIIKFYEEFYSSLPEQLSRYSTILSATPGCLKTSKIQNHRDVLTNIIGEFGFIQGEESKQKLLSYTKGITQNFFEKQIKNNFVEKKNINNFDSNPNLELYTYFGNMKFKRFEQYLNIFPEYKFLFIGDNGQGDVIAGKQMLEKYPKRCNVFIHQVCENEINYKEPSKSDKLINNLFFFKTYLELSEKFKTIKIFNDNNINKIKQDFNSQIENPIYKKYKQLNNIEIISKVGGKTKKSRRTRKLKINKKIKKSNINKKTKKSGRNKK
jgi:hypothetical protein